MARLPLDDPRWRDFVAGHPLSTPFHAPAWALLLARTYRLDGSALVELDASGAVLSGIPVLAPPRLPGRARRFVSLPFTDALAPLVGPSSEMDLAARLEATRAQLGVTRIELRAPLQGAQLQDTASVLHVLPLTSDADAVAAGFSKRARGNVRVAERRGVVVRHATCESDLTDVFFSLHLATRRRLGVPAQPRRFFRLLWHVLTEQGLGFVLVAEQDGCPVASAVFLRDARTVVYKFSASDISALAANPTALLVATAIRLACEAGCSRFDFGRSELSAEGLRWFKSGFGAVEERLSYSLVGEGELAPPGEGGGAVASVLRRSPTWATRLTGELLYRYAA